MTDGEPFWILFRVPAPTPDGRSAPMGLLPLG